MANINADNLITRIDFDINAQPSMREQFVKLAVESCPAGGSLEIEQSIEGVGTTRVKITKPAD